MRNVAYRVVLLTLAMGICAAAEQEPQNNLVDSQWLVAGHDAANSRSQPAEVQIGVKNVQSLTVKWVFTTGGDVSATPTVAGDAVFFPDWGGNLFAVNKHTGELIWSHKIADYDGSTGNAVSRTSPAIHGSDVIVGDIPTQFSFHNGANIIAADRATGALRWITSIESHSLAEITGSPVVFGDTVYVGVSSQEELIAVLGPPDCCTFRGSVVALDANSGKILWKTYLIPANGGQPGGYTGGAVWQPPAIDPARGQLYVGTGNNYSAPASVLQCQQQAIDANNPHPDCTPPDDHFDSALALDLADGHIRWSRRLQDYDVWTDACLPGFTAFPGKCPSPAGPDYDLGGSGPNLLSDLGLVGFGQKSGIYWALNADDGSIRWKTQVGPGGNTGGIQWGTATDGRRVYAAISNSNNLPYALIPSGQQITWGAWSALDVSTGNLIWQTPDPTIGAIDSGSVSVANGVMYAGSMSGWMYALDAATGEVLWSFASGGSVADGPSIVDGVLYWGSGYTNTGGANTKLYAFSIDPGE